MSEFAARITALQRELSKQKLHGLLIQNPISSLYLSGFPCSNSILLVTRTKAFFFTDFRYIVKAHQTIKHLEVQQLSQQLSTELDSYIKKLRIRRLGFEESISHSAYNVLKAGLKSSSAELTPAASIVRDMRQVKSRQEVRQIQTNQRLNEKLFESAVESVSPGQTEITVRNHILHEMIEHECEEAFASIIAAGKNSALPHAIPSKSKVKAGTFLLFDMGVKKNFYHSDMTRTLAVGERLPARAQEIYEVVLKAQKAALSEIGPGVSCSHVDKVARDIIKNAGYGEYFGHGLGHGVGLEIHEGPTLNAKSQDVLKAGMIVTVEPGIYIPELGGVRIEDLVLVTETGYKNLTKVPKNLTYLV